MLDITEERWNTEREKLSGDFARECYIVAMKLIALQKREIETLERKAAGTIDQLDLSRFAKSVKDIRDFGSAALGKTEEKQTAFDFVVRYETPRA